MRSSLFKLLVLGSLLSIWLLLVSNTNLFNTYVFANEEIKETSTIGNISIETRDREEILEQLQTAITKWKNTPIVLEGVEDSNSVSSDWIQFDLQNSIDLFLEGSDKFWFSFWKDNPVVQIPLTVTLSEEFDDYLQTNPTIDSEQTKALIMQRAAYLNTQPITPIYKDYTSLNERISFEVELIDLPINGLSLLSNDVDGTVIHPNETFSLLQYVGNVNGTLNNEEVNFFGSVLYSAVLQSNLEIDERHSHHEIHNYLQPGIEAKVHLGENKDLKFTNKNSYPVLIKSEIVGTNLIVEFYTSVVSSTGVYRVSDQIEINPRTIYRFSKDIPVGEEIILQEGKKGIRVSVFRTISETDSPFEQESLISQDYYPPVHRVVLKAPVPDDSSVPSEDSLLSIDLNGDGLPDQDSSSPQNVDNRNSQDSTSEGQDSSSNQQSLTDQSYSCNHENADTTVEEEEYDKGGNIITTGGS